MLELARIFHIFGVLLWVGGMATAAASGLTLVGKPEPEREAGMAAVRGALHMLATPGLLLAWLGGIAMLVSAWTAVYSHAGWMHGKLTIGIVLSGLHGMLLARTRPGKPASSQPFLVVLATTLILALINIALVVIRPGG